MCGIFGCVGKCQTLPILINGLELLEYRGDKPLYLLYDEAA